MNKRRRFKAKRRRRAAQQSRIYSAAWGQHRRRGYQFYTRQDIAEMAAIFLRAQREVER